MMQYVKPIDFKNNIRVGSIVPESGIEICKFNNMIKKSNNSSTVSSSSEKNLSQHKLAKLYETKTDVAIKDNSIFDTYKDYSDELGYAGVINLKTIDWVKRTENIKSFKQYTETLKVSNIDSIPRVVSKTIDGYHGSLMISKIEIIETSSTSKEISIGTLNMPYSEFIFSNSTAPASIFKKISVYNGNINRVHFDISVYQNAFSIILDTIISGKINNVFPSNITKNGLLYYPTGEFVDKTVETWVKHYGVCRYWGGGSKTSNNYYGDPDYKYNVDRWTAKGYMNGRSTPTLNKYGHTMKITNNKVSSSREKYPWDSPGGYYGPSNGITDGIQWTYDTEEAGKYGGVDGSVWMSDYWKNSGGVWPPKGYNSDYTGSTHISDIKVGGSSPISHSGVLCRRPGAQKTSLAGFWNYGGFYCKWFRDVVLFYKGKTTAKIQEGKYVGCKYSENGYTSNHISLYTGILSCDKKVTQNIVTGVTARVTYSGILSKDITLYDGKAIYEGLVYKKVFVDSSIPAPNNTMNFIIDTDGYIKDQNKNKLFKSQFIRLTNISKNGIPMMYKYDMKNHIRIPNGPKEEIYTDVKFVSLKYDTNIVSNIEYLLKLTPASGDMYKCTVYTDICIGCTDGVIVEYVDENKTITELVSCEYVFTQGIDYSSTTVDDINYSIKFASSGSTTSDNRRKIHISYIVKTDDNAYSSLPISCNVINKKYALENEKLFFMHDYHNVSPLIDLNRMSAKEIIARDNNLDIDTLIDKKFIITISGDNSYMVDSYTDVDGNGYVYMCTYEDTGFPVIVDGVTKYTGVYKQYTISESINNVIYQGLFGVLENQKGINVLNPYYNTEFKNWYPRISYYPFEIVSNRNNTNIKATYSFKEYISDSYHNALGKPYKQVTENVSIIDHNTIRLGRGNVLFKPGYISVRNRVSGKEYCITDFDMNENILKLKEEISHNDLISATYVYAETCYEYKGYDDKHLDINPNYLHTYTDLSSYSKKPSYELFNKTIYVFVKPNKVTNLNTGEIIIDNTSSSHHIYHKIDNSIPDGIYDLLIGILAVTPTSSILNTKIETASIVGGGLKNKYMQKNKDILDGFYDISSYSEKAIQKSGSFIVEIDDIDRNLVEKIIEKQKPVGVLPVYK